MNEVIQIIGAIRDIFLIICLPVATVMAVVVGRAVLDLTRKAEVLRVQATDLVTGVSKATKGMLLTIGRITGVR